jgi:hypothetical protein
MLSHSGHVTLVFTAASGEKYLNSASPIALQMHPIRVRLIGLKTNKGAVAGAHQFDTQTFSMCLRADFQFLYSE